MLHIEPGVPAATANADQLERVIANLVLNAYQAATGKGSVVEAPKSLIVEEEQLRAGRGGAVLHGGAVVGIFGRTGAEDGAPSVVLLGAVPEPMRPKQ